MYNTSIVLNRSARDGDCFATQSFVKGTRHNAVCLDDSTTLCEIYVKAYVA